MFNLLMLFSQALSSAILRHILLFLANNGTFYNLSSQQIFRFAINIFEQYITKMFFIVHLISKFGGWETTHTYIKLNWGVFVYFIRPTLNELTVPLGLKGSNV